MTGGAGCDNNKTSSRCPGQTVHEYRTEFSLWSMVAGQILVASDVRAMTSDMRSILLNREMIAVHQDPMGVPGGRVAFVPCADPVSLPLSIIARTRTRAGAGARSLPTATVKQSHCQLWLRPLANKSFALALYNSDGAAHSMDVHLAEAAGIQACAKATDSSGGCTVRDLWAQKEIAHGAVDAIHVPAIAPHATVVLKITPS